MEPRQQIRDFVRKLLSAKQDTAQFSDFTPLLSSGRLSSLDIVTIAAFLEETFAVDFAGTSFDQYKFESIDAMLELLKRRGC